MQVHERVLDEWGEWAEREPPDDPEPSGAGGQLAVTLRFVSREPPDRPPAEPALRAA